MTPAAELRAAAASLRELATTASTDDDGTPTAHWNAKPCQSPEFAGVIPDDGSRLLCGDYLTRDDGRRISWPNLLHARAARSAAYMRARHAAYAAAMGPTVGLALADWLESVASRAREEGGEWVGADLHHALAVVRAINGQP